MGRVVRRVEANFAWPIGKIWEGFVNPHWSRSRKCPYCSGGYSPEAQRLSDQWYGYAPFDPSSKGSTPWLPTEPAIIERALRNAAPGRAAELEAIRLAGHFNSWSHHLAQDEVDALVDGGRLWNFTRDFAPGVGWVDKPGNPRPSAREVNLWSVTLGNGGHDGINQWIVVKHACEKNGWPVSCGKCGGEGRLWREGAKADCEAWESSAPPEGKWWQVWETVSEGSPVSPAFEDPRELADWLAANRKGSVDEGTTSAQWLAFIVGPGWAPSMMTNAAGALATGVQASAERADGIDGFGG